ncbi:tetratricopeptide repeat protein [Massilia sp. R2A-15]|uniref:tetratricopeptide repeat protein n=1 Tax=Massilia sp. R2A-15 TaxID=3064278 RepID=UPI002735A541|nr:tetratricopeptide repeat protein [Massilia sp. R2A-15]WLI89088.1 tetratricopeptide repeat protein [Massilia sp. R2A-15]
MRVLDTAGEGDDPDEISDMGVDDAVQVALQLHRLGQHDVAEQLYRRILDAEPAHADALHFLGVLLHQRGRSDQALELVLQSIALDAAPAGRYNNLGNVLLELGQLEQAATAYREAIERDARHADACNNLGAVLRALGHLEEARSSYEQAIAIDPSHVEAYTNLGNLLTALGQGSQAVACYCKAITLMPHHPQARKLLGLAYATLGQPERAIQVYRDWLREEPDDPIALHLHAACSRRDVPARAADAYVERTFDGFAASFDAKLGKLRYRAPKLIADALEHAAGAPAHRFDILDAGCGTGWCGPLVAPYAARLTGVDLSQGMLERAAQRGSYDALEKAELQAWLARHDRQFDVIISADTLCYFGALDGVFAAARHALRPHGLLLFTLEAGADHGPRYRLEPHGRYSHARGYVRRALHLAGFAVAALEAGELRMESGKPVAGWVVTARARSAGKPAALRQIVPPAHRGL